MPLQRRKSNYDLLLFLYFITRKSEYCNGRIYNGAAVKYVRGNEVTYVLSF